MRSLRRRDLIVLLGTGAVLTGRPSAADSATDAATRFFLDEAMRMRAVALAAGDQPYGAVLVKDGRIIGYGPSRVVAERDTQAHAERVAIREALRRHPAAEVAGAELYSTAMPCRLSERAAAAAGVARLIHGAAATDAGRPRA